MRHSWNYGRSSTGLFTSHDNQGEAKYSLGRISGCTEGPKVKTVNIGAEALLFRHASRQSDNLVVFELPRGRKGSAEWHVIELLIASCSVSATAYRELKLNGPPDSSGDNDRYSITLKATDLGRRGGMSLVFPVLRSLIANSLSRCLIGMFKPDVLAFSSRRRSDCHVDAYTHPVFHISEYRKPQWLWHLSYRPRFLAS